MKKRIISLLALVMTVMGASAQAASYALTVAESDDSHGSIAFTVGGQSVGTAAAGATVTVTVTPEKGWALKTLTAETYMTGGEMRTRTRGIGDNPPTVSILGDVTLNPVEGNPNQFTMTMPSANVRFSADYLIATEITLENETINTTVLNVQSLGATLTSNGVALASEDTGGLTYTSSNEQVAVVMSGAIIPCAAGECTITVSYGGNGTYAAAESKTIAVTVVRNATEIILEQDAYDLKVGDEVPTGVTLSPEIIILTGTTTYTSSDESVAKVVDKAVDDGTVPYIQAVGQGNCTITVSFAFTPPEGEEESTEKYEDKIFMTPESKTIAVTVTLNESSVSVNNLPPDGSCLYVDDTFTLIPTTTPEGLDVTYIPDNSGVVSVDEKGVVTALKEGTASITVKIGGDGVYAESSTTVTLTVTKVPTEITVEKATLELKVGDEVSTGASLTPAGAGNLVYTSSNEKVAVVKDGKIKALAAGTATITVSFAGDDKYAAAESQTIALTVILEGDSNNDGVVNVSDVVKAVSDGKTQAEIDAIVDIIMGRK